MTRHRETERERDLSCETIERQRERGEERWGIHELGTGKAQGVVNQAKVGSKIALLCGHVGTSTVIDYNASMVYARTCICTCAATVMASCGRRPCMPSALRPAIYLRVCRAVS